MKIFLMIVGLSALTVQASEIFFSDDMNSDWLSDIDLDEEDFLNFLMQEVFDGKDIDDKALGKLSNSNNKKERIREYMKNTKNDPENYQALKEKKRQYQKQCYDNRKKNHPEKYQEILEKNKQRRRKKNKDPEKHEKDREKQNQYLRNMKENHPEKYEKRLEQQRQYKKEQYKLQKVKLMSDPEAYEAYRIKERERKRQAAARKKAEEQLRNLAEAPVEIALLGKREREEGLDGRALEQASEVKHKRIRQESPKGSEQ